MERHPRRHRLVDNHHLLSLRLDTGGRGVNGVGIVLKHVDVVAVAVIRRRFIGLVFVSSPSVSTTASVPKPHPLDRADRP